MPIKSIMSAVSVLGLLSVTGIANAGNCAGPDCRLGVSYIQGPAPQFGPMTVRDRRPMGYLRSVNFQRAPHISIMRVHSLEARPGLSDAPVAFTGGCHPQSTEYCRQDAGVPVSVELYDTPAPQAPQVQIPQVQAPQPPTYSPPQVDYSHFQPRQYGDAGFVPGIAHIPTSIVDRSPENADRALNSRRAVAQPLANGGVAPRPSMLEQRYEYEAQTYSAPARVMPSAPVRSAPSHGLSGLAGAPVLQNNGTYGSTVGADGTYWEKTSGPTFFGDTLATQVICKRKVETRVVNPVIGVPVPTCNSAQPHAPHQGHAPQQGQPYPGWSY